MLLNSYYFIVFFIILFFLYWGFAKTSKKQNLLLLAASVVFYCSWSTQFIFLLGLTVIATFIIGKKMIDSPMDKRKIWLRLGIIIVLGQLFYFKYSNFFIENVNVFLQAVGLHSSINMLKILMPIGISFYSFRMLGYLIDIKNNKIKAVPTLLNYANFISFFPAIIAGPIDKASPFFNQLNIKRNFSPQLFTEGLRQILWGLFKKLVVADNLAQLTQPVFDHYTDFSGSTLFLMAIFYFLQLYADFSGYSDMAIGISKLLGFRIQINFNYPIFAQNVADYWRRWHISLTSWLTEYIFTPLSIQFRDYGKWGLIAAITINFLAVGFWHGAEWHYIVHGLVSGLMFIPLILSGKMNKKVKSENKVIPPLKELINIGITFILFSLLMILFFVKDMQMAVNYYQKIFSFSLFNIPDFPIQKEKMMVLALMLVIEWIGRGDEFAIKAIFEKSGRVVRWGFYYVLIILIFLFYISPKGFIYAQF